MTATSLDSWAVAASYENVEKLILQTAHRFHKQYGGDFEELLAQARLHFVECYASHDADKAQFTTWLVFKTWRQLQSQLRRTLVGRRGKQTIPLDSPELLAERRHFDLAAFLNDLSEDAKTVASLTLDAPMDVTLAMRGMRKRKGEQGRCANLKGALVEFLQDMGWTTQRIGESFKEIGEALLQGGGR